MHAKPRTLDSRRVTSRTWGRRCHRDRPAFPANRDLSRFVRDYTPALAFLARVNMSGFRDAQRVMLNWALALQGRTAGPLSLSNEHLDENEFIARYSGTAPLFMTILRCAKLHLCVVFDEPASGVEAVERAREVTIPGTMWPVLEDFWSALVLAAAHETATPEQRVRYTSRIGAVVQSLDELAGNCPENFRCFSLLVAAEQAVLQGQEREQFVSMYQDAIAYAVATNNVQQEALANDLCARRLIAARDLSGAADSYVSRAYRAVRYVGGECQGASDAAAAPTPASGRSKPRVLATLVRYSRRWRTSWSLPPSMSGPCSRSPKPLPASSSSRRCSAHC